jgi:hypothetical protein
MAHEDRRSDVDKLLAEVDGMLTGTGSTPTRSVQPHGEAQTGPSAGPGGLVPQVRAAAVSGAVAAGVVGFLFLILPFLSPISGAAGAFLAASVAVLVFRRRR